MQKIADYQLRGTLRARTALTDAQRIIAADEPTCGELPPGAAGDAMRHYHNFMQAAHRRDKKTSSRRDALRRRNQPKDGQREMRPITGRRYDRRDAIGEILADDGWAGLIRRIDVREPRIMRELRRQPHLVQFLRDVTGRYLAEHAR